MSKKETEFLFQNQFNDLPDSICRAPEDKDDDQSEDEDPGIFETEEGDLVFDVTRGRSEDFSAASAELSDYIKALPLTQEQNNGLVGKAVQAVVTAERDAFMYAFGLVLSAVEAAEEETGEKIL